LTPSEHAWALESPPEPGNPYTYDWCYLPKYDHGATDDTFCVPVPYYSTEMAAAWLVVEAVRRRMAGHDWVLRSRGEDWVASVWHYAGGATWTTGDSVAITAPLAICRAALAAVKSCGP
jgi:hypothetical protein